MPAKQRRWKQVLAVNLLPQPTKHTLFSVSSLKYSISLSLNNHSSRHHTHQPPTTMGKNILFGILWLLCLVFIAWPVAGFCAGFWILLQVTTLKACIPSRNKIEYSYNADTSLIDPALLPLLYNYDNSLSKPSFTSSKTLRRS